MPILELDRDRNSFDVSKLFPVLLALLTVVLYANSLSGPRVFDDLDHLVVTTGGEPGWGLKAKWFTPDDRRPVFKWTIQVNKQMNVMMYGNEDPEDQISTPIFHLTNMVIHVLAVLTLYGLIRQTLWLPMFDKRYGDRASYLAGAVALVWAVHPLQTQAVSYIVQRCESMMGLFFLLTLYCTVRGAVGRNKVWYLLAVVACALGMGTKEVMIVAPFVALLFDRAFITGSFVETFKRRWALYALMILPLAIAVVVALQYAFSGSEVATSGFAIKKLTWHEYLVTQFGVILHYLRLSFLPWRFSLDYQDWPITRDVSKIVLTGIPIVALFGLSLYGLIRNTWWGFLGAAFFLILAPSSSIMPINDLVMEHRMYLPLATLVVLVVFLIDALLRKLAVADADTAKARTILASVLVGAVAVWLSITTFVRNNDYTSDVRMYETVLETRPNNTRAMRNAASALGNIYARDGDKDALKRASVHLAEYLRRKPDDLEARLAMARMYMDLGEPEKSIAEFNQVLKMNDVDAEGYYQVGWGYFNAKMFLEAEVQLLKALELKPTDPKLISDIHMMLARVLVATNRPVEAEGLMAQVLEKNPELANVQVEYGLLMLDLNRLDKAYSAFMAALKSDPANIEAMINLGAMYLNNQQPTEALQFLEPAAKLAIDPSRPASEATLLQIFNNMAKAYATRDQPGTGGQPSDLTNAYRLFFNMLAIDKDHPEALSNIGNVLRLGGRADMAAGAMEKSVELAPTSPEFLRRLAWLRATTWDAEEIDGPRAVMLAERANKATGGEKATVLDTLAAALARVGDFDRAIEAATKARDIATSGDNTRYADEIQQRLDLYQSSQPYTEPQPPEMPL